MKKFFIMMLLSALCCFAGCEAKQPSDDGQDSYSSQESQNSQGGQDSQGSQEGQGSQDSTIITTPYTAETLGSVFFTDTEKGLTVDVSENTYLQTLLLGVEYHTPQGDATPDIEEVKHMLSLQGAEEEVTLQIGVEGAVCFVFEDGSKQRATVLNNEFSYLDTLIDGGITAFEGYTTSHNLQVHDAVNEGGTVKDKAAFLQHLQGVRIIKLTNQAHYRLGEKTYTVHLGRDELLVYQKHVIYKEELYVIHQGDFDFLKDLEFTSSTDSSGWLPWV